MLVNISHLLSLIFGCLSLLMKLSIRLNSLQVKHWKIINEQAIKLSLLHYYNMFIFSWFCFIHPLPFLDMLTQLSALLASSSFWIFMSSFRGDLGRLAYVEANIFYFVSDSNALSTCSILGFFFMFNMYHESKLRLWIAYLTVFKQAHKDSITLHNKLHKLYSYLLSFKYSPSTTPFSCDHHWEVAKYLFLASFLALFESKRYSYSSSTNSSHGVDYTSHHAAS